MWQISTFNELELTDLEQILRLRQSIFIVEQQSSFEDIDGNDPRAIHIFNKDDNGQIWAYCRILIDDVITLGRVTVNPEKRGNGSGRNLLNFALEFLDTEYPSKNIEIVAMSYLRDFYKSFGFKTVSEVYIMDHAEHEDMLLIRK